jgi:hypothetical protein
VLPALPLAAALTLVAARSLPLRFEYRPNDLGIVSVATELRYPLQQETFYLVFALLASTLVTWLLSRGLGRKRPRAATALALEALATAVLVGVLWLPLLPGWALAVIGTLCALAIAGRAGEAEPAPARPAEPAPARRLRGVPWLLGVLVLAPLLTPGLAFRVWAVAEGIPDDLLVENHFKFLAETGQHLAWADALRAGRLHGRDFFCLYGPLYDLGAVAMWALVGRSIAAWNLYISLTRALAWAALLLLGGALVRRRALALLPIFLLPWINLRVGLPLLGLLFLSKGLAGSRGSAAAAGASGGLALLFSQEHGAAFLAAAALVLFLRGDRRAALAFGAALAAPLAPLLAWYAAEGALVPMLRDLSQYPAYVLAGFGNLPFPRIERSLMGDARAAGGQASLVLRLGYAVPGICLGALLLALPVSAVDPRRPRATLRELCRELRGDAARLSILAVAVFGLLSFRSALGRSDLLHLLPVLPAAALLLAVGVDRALDERARAAGPAATWLALWRGAALVLLVLHAGLLQVTSPAALIRESFQNVSALLQRVPLPAGDPAVARVARFVRRHTQPGEPVLFLPNDAAYYYLADRPSPVRFVLGHQMVTDAHRAEALDALRARPPRYVVWNRGSLRVDDLPDEKVFGPALLAWIEAHYGVEARIGGVEILRWRGGATP